jgi:hypothetical protein
LRHAIFACRETISAGMTCFGTKSLKNFAAEPVMNGRIEHYSEAIDGKTSRSICDAVGERLQQSLRPDSLDPSAELQHLLEQLRSRDSENRRKLPNQFA